MERPHPPDATDVRDYLRPLWARRWLILAIALLVPAATFAYFASKPKQYTASTDIFVRTSQVDQLLFEDSGQQGDDRNNQNLATLIESRTVASRAADKVGFRGDPTALLDSVTAVPAQGSDFVTVEATRGSPREAADLANAFANAFIEGRTLAIQQRTQTARELAEQQLARIGEGPETAGARRALRERIRRLGSLEALPAGGAEQVDPAVVPRAPSAPRPVRNAVFAFVLALLFGVGAAFGLERLDRRIKRLDEVQSLYGQPLLAAVPHADQTAPIVDGEVVMAPALREAFRTLNTNIRLADVDRRVDVILVTSAVPAEGKSTVVRNLALIYREAGLRVAVIESDLRKPTLAKLFDVEREPGLSEVLIGRERAGDVMQDVEVNVTGLPVLANLPVREGGADGGAAEFDAGRLSVLTSGAEPPNPPAVLAAERVRTLLAEIAADHDIVLVDSSPMLPVSDTIPLLAAADGVILVTRLGETTRDAARRVRDVLGRIPDANVLGVVANDVSDPTIEHGSYGYYGYGRS